MCNIKPGNYLKIDSLLQESSNVVKALLRTKDPAHYTNKYKNLTKPFCNCKYVYNLLEIMYLKYHTILFLFVIFSGRTHFCIFWHACPQYSGFKDLGTWSLEVIGEAEGRHGIDEGRGQVELHPPLAGRVVVGEGVVIVMEALAQGQHTHPHVLHRPDTRVIGLHPVPGVQT